MNRLENSLEPPFSVRFSELMKQSKGIHFEALESFFRLEVNPSLTCHDHDDMIVSACVSRILKRPRRKEN
jgi:hypothetical protein